LFGVSASDVVAQIPEGQIPPNSSTWPGKHEFDELLPAGWSIMGDQNAFSVSDGILHFDSIGLDGVNLLINEKAHEFDWDNFEAGIEIRARFDEIEGQNVAAAFAAFDVIGTGFGISWHSWGTPSLQAYGGIGLDVSGWHVYRFHLKSCDPNNPACDLDRLQIFIDGQLKAERIPYVPFQRREIPDRNGWMYFPDNSYEYGGKYEFDYVRWYDGEGEVLTPGPFFEWTENNLGSWTTNANWDSVGHPNSSKQTARFGNNVNITGPTTAVVSSAVTVKRIEFENATHSYAVAGLGSVNLSADTGNGNLPSIDVVAGNHEFQARVNFLDDALLNVESNSSLAFNTEVNLNGKMIFKTGPGTLAFNNYFSSGTGGTGTTNGDLVNNSIVSPGNPSGATAVPEPSSWILFASGLVLIVSRRRKWHYGRQG